jgi:hypothetical protein
MATWKKVIVSGSIASLAEVSASVGFKGNLVGNATTATTATQVGNSLTVDNSTIQLNSGTTYDGAAGKTISIKDGGVTLAKIESIANNTILGNITGDTAAPSALTKANVLELINVENGADVTDAAGIRALGAGIVSSSAQVSALGGVQNSTITVTAGNGLSGGGSFTTNTGSNGTISLAVGVDDSTIELNSDALRIKDSGVTFAKIQNVATDTIVGRTAASDGVVKALSKSEVLEILNVQDGANAFTLTAAGVRGLGAGIHSGSISAASVTEISNLTADEGAQLENIGTTTISATQWGYLGAMNQGVTNSSNVQFANMVVTGDLTVEGSRTELNVANLNVEDQFILINSGSAGADAGIIFGGSSGTAQAGHAIYWERTGAGTGNFGFVEELAHNATSANIDSKLGNIQTSTGANPTTAPTFQGVGTINVRTDDETIWIYS